MAIDEEQRQRLRHRNGIVCLGTVPHKFEWQKLKKEREQNEKWKIERKSCGGDRGVERNRRRNRETIGGGRRGSSCQLCIVKK